MGNRPLFWQAVRWGAGLCEADDDRLSLSPVSLSPLSFLSPLFCLSLSSLLSLSFLSPFSLSLSLSQGPENGEE